MGRRNAKTERATDEMLDGPPTMMIQSEDLPVVLDNHRVFLRAETSFSETEEDDDGSSGDERSVFLLDPASTKAKSLRQCNEQLLELPVAQQKSYTVVADKKQMEKYMSSREMTPLQERMNALTMIPTPMFCLCLFLSGNWIRPTHLEESVREMQVANMSLEEAAAAFESNDMCMDWSSVPLFGRLFENLHAIPPLPLLAMILGTVCTVPCSFLYHWKYAHVLHPTKRTNHWSRRMDQSMLHVSCSLFAFATCGSWDFFLINVIFNADSICRQFESKVRPRRNQARLGIAIVAWTIPILKRGDMDLFCRIILTLATGIFLFIRYPIGGWSHSAFHLCWLPLAPLMMEVSTQLPASQEHLKEAARCFALAEHRATFFA